MPNVALNTTTNTYDELVGNGRIYHVPPYQRDYSWDKEEWEDLWLDILALEDEQYHYMGYTVFQIEDGKKFQIIDGQQRLATFSIIAVAVLKVLDDWIKEKIEPKPNEERKELLRSKFLGHKDPSSLIPSSKLFLNKNNNDFYQSYILRMRKPANVSKLKPSQKLLWKAFEFFYTRIKDLFKNEKDGKAISRFLNETIADRMVFTSIQVTDDLNAYKVFETLNARGVRLSTTDLLKNFLFSIVAGRSEIEFQEAERQWQNINNVLGSKEFPVFLRHYWNGRNESVRKQSLFKAIKKTIVSPGDVFKLLNDLEKMAPVYTAFSNPADELWNKEQRQALSALLLFNITQCYSMLLAAYEKLEPKEFTRLLRDCAVISFRYNVIGGLNPTATEKAYDKAAKEISEGKLTWAKHIFNVLKPVYVSDENFINDFTTREINTKRKKKLVRYILFSIENQLAEKNYDYEDATATIEHILPENPEPDWENYFPVEEIDTYIYRLGNYTLMEERKNRMCGTRPYEEKKEIYKDSAYKLTGVKSIYTDWTPSTLRKRQEGLARLAATVWKINY